MYFTCIFCANWWAALPLFLSFEHVQFCSWRVKRGQKYSSFCCSMKKKKFYFSEKCTCAHEKNKAQKVFFAMYFTCILASISSFCLPTFSQFLFYFPRENLSETHALHMCNYPFRSLTFMFFPHRSRLYIEGWVGDFFPTNAHLYIESFKSKITLFFLFCTCAKRSFSMMRNHFFLHPQFRKIQELHICTLKKQG